MRALVYGAVRLIGKGRKHATSHPETGYLQPMLTCPVDPHSVVPQSEPITTSPPASPSAAAKAAVRRLALQYSHPTWLVSRWLPRFGPDATPQLLQHNNTPPVYTVRINPLRLGGGGRAGPGGGRGSRELVQRVVEDLTRAGVDAEPSPYLPGEFIRVRSGLQRLLAEVRAAGCTAVQHRDRVRRGSCSAATRSVNIGPDPFSGHAI